MTKTNDTPGAPGAPELKVRLEELTELDGGGARLAVGDGLVAVGTDEDVRVWRDREEVAAVEAPDAIDRLRFGRGEKELLAAPYALDLATHAWAPLADLEPVLIHGLDGPPSGDLKVRRADWSADGQEALLYVEHRPARGIGRGTARGPGARLLWIDRARRVLAVPWTGGNFALTSVVLGGRWAAAGGRELLVWDRRTKAAAATLRPHELVIREVAFSADDRWLASVGNDHRVAVIDTATWQTAAGWEAHDGDAVSVAFHPARPLLATTGQDGQVRVWSLAGKRLAERALGRPGTAVAFSPDGGRLLAASDDRVTVLAVHIE